MSQFSERLRAARKIREITQEQLAEMADISRAMVGRYESSDQLPSIETLIHIADTLGVSTDFLLGRIESIDVVYTPHFEKPPTKKNSELPTNMEELELLIRRITLDILNKAQ